MSNHEEAEIMADSMMTERASDLKTTSSSNTNITTIVGNGLTHSKQTVSSTIGSMSDEGSVSSENVKSESINHSGHFEGFPGIQKPPKASVTLPLTMDIQADSRPPSSRNSPLLVPSSYSSAAFHAEHQERMASEALSTQSMPLNSHVDDNSVDNLEQPHRRRQSCEASGIMQASKFSASIPSPPSSQNLSSAVVHTTVINSLQPKVPQQPLPAPIAKAMVSSSSGITSSYGCNVGNHSSLTSAAPLPPYSSSYYDDKQGEHDIVEQSPQSRYVRFQEKLGSGAYKDVFRAYDTIEGIEVAWNQVNLAGIPKSDKARIINEVRLLERLHHANIISFHGSWVNREREQVIFVTEILSSGTLKSFINKVKVIRWRIAKRWAIQILKGLEYLHSQNPPIIHRDLKCDNIFINGTTGDLRIGDLGLSTVISSKSKVLSVLGTPEFMAPELYDESYDEKVDIYAFGMCMLEIFTKEVPYRECHNPAQIYKKVTNGVPPASLARVKSRHAKEFIQLCLGTIPDANGEYRRPSAAELLQHPFLQKRPEDEQEVEVLPPGREPIAEEVCLEALDPANISSILPPGPGSSRQEDACSLDNGPQQKQHHHPSAPQLRVSASSDPLSSHLLPQASQGPPVAVAVPTDDPYEEGQTDHLSSMPVDEGNMRKVTVMMGRDQVLVEDDGDMPYSAHSHLSGRMPASPSGKPNKSQEMTRSGVQTLQNQIKSEQGLRVPGQDQIPLKQSVGQAQFLQSSQATEQPPYHQHGQQISDPQQFYQVGQQNFEPQQQQYYQQVQQNVGQQHMHQQQQRLSSSGLQQQQNQRPHSSGLQQRQTSSGLQQQHTDANQPNANVVLPSMIPTTGHQGKNVIPNLQVNTKTSQLDTSQNAPNHPQVMPPQQAQAFHSPPGTQSVHSQHQHESQRLDHQRLANASESLQYSVPQSPHANPATGPQSRQNYPVSPFGGEAVKEEVMKLILTLPFEGKTSNVQFDFHLIEDDPVQVAREMVTELGIPETAVLEISETISGLARAARIKQQEDKKIAQQQHQPQMQHGAANVAGLAQVSPNPLQIQQIPVPQQSQQHVQQQTISGHSSVQQPSEQQHPLVIPIQPANQQQQPGQRPVVSHSSGNPSMSQSVLSQHGHAQIVQQQPVQVAQMHRSHGEKIQHSVPHITMPPQSAQFEQTMQFQKAGVSFDAGQETVPVVATPVSNQTLQGDHVYHEMNGGGGSLEPFINLSGDDAIVLPERLDTDLVLRTDGGVVSMSQSAPTIDEEEVDEFDGHSSFDEDSVASASTREELKRMEEEFQKTLQRAKKVYEARMENLHRSLNDFEAQHIQNLKKHEKERADFEKKAKLSEAEHSKRLKELEQQWNLKRAELTRKKQEAVKNGMKKMKSQQQGNPFPVVEEEQALLHFIQENMSQSGDGLTDEK